MSWALGIDPLTMEPPLIGPVNAPAVALSRLDILAISWNPANLRQAMQGADNVTGPWTDAPGTTASPYLVRPVGQKKFICVIQRAGFLSQLH